MKFLETWNALQRHEKGFIGALVIGVVALILADFFDLLDSNGNGM